MLARSRPRRRPFIYALIALTTASLVYLFGPPIFSPSSHANHPTVLPNSVHELSGTASKWAHSLEHEVSSIYHTGTSLNSSPRIRQATMLYEGDRDHLRPMYERAVKTHLEHGERWGVPTHVMKRHVVEEGSFFNKPAFLLMLVMQEMGKAKGERGEWVVWFDADSVVMNPEVSWEMFLPPGDFADKDFLMTKDNNGFNAGMMILRVCERTVDMLAQVLAIKGLRDEVELPFYDQSAIDWVCQRDGFKEHFVYQPRRWWNRYFHDADGEEKGLFVVHFAGINTVGTDGTRTKIDRMTEWLNRAEGKESGDWARSVKKIGLEKEIEDFWERLRRAKKLVERGRERVKQEKEEREEESDDGDEGQSKLEEATEKLMKLVLRGADATSNITDASKKLEGLLGN